MLPSLAPATRKRIASSESAWPSRFSRISSSAVIRSSLVWPATGAELLHQIRVHAGGRGEPPVVLDEQGRRAGIQRSGWARRWIADGVAQHVPTIHVEEATDELAIDRVLPRRAIQVGPWIMRSELHPTQGHVASAVRIENRPPDLISGGIRRLGVESLIPDRPGVVIRFRNVKGNMCAAGRHKAWRDEEDASVVWQIRVVGRVSPSAVKDEFHPVRAIRGRRQVREPKRR